MNLKHPIVWAEGLMGFFAAYTESVFKHALLTRAYIEEDPFEGITFTLTWSLHGLLFERQTQYNIVNTVL